jgi:hypothetical protein
LKNFADDFISDKAWSIQWNYFAEFSKLNDKGISDLQRNEMRKAFFFGVGAALTGMKVLSNIEDEEFGASIFEGWEQEFWDFCQEFETENDRN